MTLPWATMTSDGARRVWSPRGEPAEEEEEEEEDGAKEAVQGSVDAHDGDAIAQAVCFPLLFLSSPRKIGRAHV